MGWYPHTATSTFVGGVNPFEAKPRVSGSVSTRFGSLDLPKRPRPNKIRASRAKSETVKELPENWEGSTPPPIPEGEEIGPQSSPINLLFWYWLRVNPGSTAREVADAHITTVCNVCNRLSIMEGRWQVASKHLATESSKQIVKHYWVRES